MSKFFGGGMDLYNGTLFFWIGDLVHVLAGIPDKDSVYVKLGPVVAHQVSGKMQVGRYVNVPKET